MTSESEIVFKSECECESVSDSEFFYYYPKLISLPFKTNSTSSELLSSSIGTTIKFSPVPIQLAKVTRARGEGDEFITFRSQESFHIAD